MSVQKYVVNKESSNFTIISNKVINGLGSNLELLGFYLYLLSLPPNWSFHKNQLKTQCGLGIKKLEKFLKLLVHHNLIHVGQNRDSKGKFTFMDLTVYNGEHFKNIDLQELSTPCVKNRPTDNGSTVKNTYKRNIIKKEYKEREPARKKREPLSDDFVFDDANKMLCKERGLNEKEVLAKFKAFYKGKTADDWQNKAQLWVLREKNTKSESKPNQEIRSTVPEYGPGHPTWEALHGQKEKSHGSEISRNNAGTNSVRKAQDYLLR